MKEDCALCGDEMLYEISIKIGEMNLICRECYSLMALHFSGLTLVECDEDGNERDNTSKS